MHKYIRFFLKLLKVTMMNQKLPLWVNINLTHKCNLSCIYCNLPTNQKDLDVSFWLSLISELQKQGTSVIGLIGAEPLLYKDIDQIIQNLVQKKIIINLYTNGILIEKKLNTIKKVDNLFISLDGSESAHDLNRGKGSYKKVIHSLEILNNCVPITLICTITLHNYDEIDEVIRLAKRYKCNVVFQKYVENLDSKPLEQNSKELITSTLNKIIQRKKEGHPVANSFHSLNHLASHTSSRSKCLGGKKFLDISADGLIFPCFEGFQREKNSIDSTSQNISQLMDQFAHIDCDCENSCGIDTNEILSFNINSIINACKQVLKKTFSTKSR